MDDITLGHDANWLNISAVGDVQRTVGARLDSADAREQQSTRGTYVLRLPLARDVEAERTTQRASEGYTEFVLRKVARNSEWAHLIREPSRTAYKHHMSVDFKRFDAGGALPPPPPPPRGLWPRTGWGGGDGCGAADEDEDEAMFKVERVTSNNVDDVIAGPGTVVLQFHPDWVPAPYARHWVQGFGQAAEALEGRATFGRSACPPTAGGTPTGVPG
jgi:hypothetical protein